MKAPETLYLTDEDSNFEAETYWCEDKVGENDVKYIRADLVPQIKDLTDEEIYEVWKKAMQEEAKIEYSIYATQLERQPFIYFARAILRKAQE